MSTRLNPKELTLGGKKYFLHKIPALPAHEISICLEDVSNPDKVIRSMELTRKILSYVSVDSSGVELDLNSDDVINNHVADSEALSVLVAEELKYNFSFLKNVSGAVTPPAVAAPKVS